MAEKPYSPYLERSTLVIPLVVTKHPSQYEFSEDASILYRHDPAQFTRLKQLLLVRAQKFGVDVFYYTRMTPTSSSIKISWAPRSGRQSKIQQSNRY